MKLALKIIIPFLIIAAAIFGVITMIASKEAPKSKQPAAVIPTVPVVTVAPADHAPPVITFGTVQAQFETNLTAQVAGKITEISPDFRIGKTVPAKAVLARIDPTDYQAALTQQQYNLSVAKRTLAEEEILAKQAAEDWTTSGRDISKASDFVLRKPQLEAAKANITSTESAITKATEDIARTDIIAPFDAIVTSRTASPGNLATTQTVLGVLLSYKKAEIRLPLTIEQVARINLPTPDKPITIKLTTPTAPDIEWSAQLVRTEPTVDAKNQITYLIAEIENPYTAAKRPLPIGTFVNAIIPARTIQNTYKIPETALVNDSYIWTSDKNDNDKPALTKRLAKRIYSQNGQAFIRLTENDNKQKITTITRPLTNFTAGTIIKPMPLSKEDDKTEPKN